MSGCSVFETWEPVSGLDSLQNQNAATALLDLHELEDIDTLIRLDNRQLAKQFEIALRAESAPGGTYSFRKIRFIFNNQIILLESIVDIKDTDEHTITGALSGDVRLKYRGNGLEWQPHFSQLQISSKDFEFENGKYAEAIPEFTETILHNLNTDVAHAVIDNERNTIPLNPVPLGEIQVGASLPGFAESNARNTQSLRGVFMIAGSAILIDSSTTSIALDMAFIPELSTCPADIIVSRAEFASAIKAREPVVLTRNKINATDLRYFYSEIEGATRPLTIIHYWFADGLPLATEELAVGPSERWRTWSSNVSVNNDVSQWEVLVVEKESGCILASKSIRIPDQGSRGKQADQGQASLTFREFKDEFNGRTAGFSISNEEPGIALIEVRRSFLREVMQSAMADLSIDVGFEESDLSALSFAASLQPFDTDDIFCEQRDCPQAPVCKTTASQCKRLRDTRDCSSCKFRNPLNNRCVSEAVDPLCEAARNRQNAKYENERTACIAHAEDDRRECERLNAQALSSCQIEAGFEESACESVKTGLQALDQDAPLAFVSAQTHASGELSANFSNFMIEGDLEQLKLNMRLQSNMHLEGDLNFEPTGSLGKCIALWSAPFTSRFISTPSVNSLLSNFEQTPDMLTANWSGFGVTIETRPSPMESIFVDNPKLLANCKIGLTVARVEQAIAGDDAAFFRGQIDLLLQPLPTKIHLAPATISFGNMVYSGEADLSAEQLKYDIHE